MESRQTQSVNRPDKGREESTMNLEIGKTYFLFCKFPDMSRFAMLDPHGYTTNRKIHASCYRDWMRAARNGTSP